MKQLLIVMQPCSFIYIVSVPAFVTQSSEDLGSVHRVPNISTLKQFLSIPAVKSLPLFLKLVNSS